MNKNTQYAVAAAIVLYIVFYTRPAPAAVSNMLSSTVAQIAALGVVVYVGAKQSLLVAAVLAVALVMSVPGREFMTNDDKKKLDKVEPDTKPLAQQAGGNVKPKVEASIKKDGADATKPMKPPAAKEDVVPPQADKAKTDQKSKSVGQPEAIPEKKGSEPFSLMNAAPF